MPELGGYTGCGTGVPNFVAYIALGAGVPYLGGYTSWCAGVLVVLAVQVGRVAVVVLDHLAALQRLQGGRVVHCLLYRHRVLPRPLLHFVVHLGDLFLVHGPEAALPLVSPVGGRLLDLLEALVEREVVPDRVLPPVGRRLEVGEMLTELERMN